MNKTRFTLNTEQLSRGQALANSWEPAKLLGILAKNPRTVRDGNLDYEEGDMPEAPIFQEEGTKGLGNLSCLPNELVDMIFNMLDMPSAIRLSYVNRTANNFVRKGPVPFLRRWAPGLPKILKQTQIHKTWAIADLKDAIRRENCVVCGNLCVQLYLPTMERICHACMHDNHAYWCLPVEQAALIFGLDLPDVIDYQTMYLPRMSLNGRGLDDISAWVVPVKVALTRALELYGTRKAIKRAAEGKLSGMDEPQEHGTPDDEEFVIENENDIYRAASLSSNFKRLRPIDTVGMEISHIYHHDVTCQVPVVPNGNTRKILQLCRGCTAMLTISKIKGMDKSHVQSMGIDPELDVFERGLAFYHRAFRVRTEAEMVEHIRTECAGSWTLLCAESENEAP
ncbi:uncharacterized protein PGRI_047180 [Penicillium griseofulvum]|uniref:F-box domain-containing protein n=1 Tax=Penicillium patulum TaxID=5078 RepID=A0A135LA47_PENPA|nr:uncharacterized protein PGRI_047180 [Penicillium griseofulvum]KXG45862.1 hypothetical protein PGRI_047180 [Penicillium griseofulvum]